MDEPHQLVIVAVPALVVLLLDRERRKGSPLTEVEVLDLRDGCACIALPAAEAQTFLEKRGYDDVSLDNVWSDWQAFRTRQSEDPGR